MKVLLAIGSTKYVCGSADEAAKIADAIGKLLPCDTRYVESLATEVCFASHVIIHGANYAHKVSIEGLSTFHEFASDGHLQEWLADRAKADAATKGGAA